MMIRMKNRLGLFRKEESGAAILMEFVIMVPLVFGIFFMSMELGMYSIRQMLLDRSVDVVTREVRLNTGEPMTHDGIKEMICLNSGGLDDCDTELRLEMITVNPRSFTGLEARADCVDTTAAAKPVRGFNLGEQHDLMLLRACYNFSPMFPASGLGLVYYKNGAGKVPMSTISAFVQEPVQ